MPRAIPHLSAAFGFALAAGAALAADRPAEDAKPLSQIAAVLEASGYVIHEAEYDDHVWEIEAVQNGVQSEIDVDAKTGEILKTRQESLDLDRPADGDQPLSQIADTVEKEGYLIAEADYKRGTWKIEAFQGDAEFDLRVDARTGKILAEKQNR